MATKTINTRIKNRFDTLENWTKDGVTLLPGEIALTRVTTTQTDEATGKVVHVPAVLMKVGTNYTEAEAADKGNAALKDTPKPFNELPWLSAKAADVYGWAKTETAEGVNINIEDIEVSDTEATDTSKSLGKWIKSVYETGSTNTTSIAAINATLETLVGTDGATGSIADAIAAAIEALDHEGDKTEGSTEIVKAVTQKDGKVKVTYGTITNDELPNDISASKIVVTPAVGEDAAVMLDGKLDTIDSSIAAINTILGGVTEVKDAEGNSVSTVVGAIDAKISTLDYADNEATQGADAASDTYFVTSTIQENGKIKVTKQKLPTASPSAAGIVKLGATGGAATYESIFGTDGNGGIKAQVDTNAANIAAIETAIAGGVHFRGITTTDISDGSTTATITLVKVVDGVDTEESYSVDAGDVVIYRQNTGTEEDPEYLTEREFIWTGSAWEELGDLTRTGALETLVNSLSEDSPTANQFVTHITKNADGTFAVNKARPTAADISYTVNSDVKAALDAHAGQLSDIEDKLSGVTDYVGKSIKDALDTLDFSDPSVPTTGTTTATAFIDTVVQTNGIILATKKKLPEASTSDKGIVQLSSDLTDASKKEEAKAATIKAVYDVKQTADKAAADVASVAANYVSFKPISGTDKYSMHLGEDADIIIFDCGGAE